MSVRQPSGRDRSASRDFKHTHTHTRNDQAERIQYPPHAGRQQAQRRRNSPRRARNRAPHARACESRRGWPVAHANALPCSPSSSLTTGHPPRQRRARTEQARESAAARAPVEVLALALSWPSQTRPSFVLCDARCPRLPPCTCPGRPACQLCLGGRLTLQPRAERLARARKGARILPRAFDPSRPPACLAGGHAP